MEKVTQMVQFCLNMTHTHTLPTNPLTRTYCYVKHYIVGCRLCVWSGSWWLIFLCFIFSILLQAKHRRKCLYSVPGWMRGKKNEPPSKDTQTTGTGYTMECEYFTWRKSKKQWILATGGTLKISFHFMYTKLAAAAAHHHRLWSTALKFRYIYVYYREPASATQKKNGHKHKHT